MRSSREDGHRISETSLAKNSRTMKKVEIANEKMTVGQLKKGLVVSGRLVLKETKDGRLALYFIPYNRQPRIRRKEVLIHTLEFGRVTETAQRVRLYESIPKKLGLARITCILDRETREAKTVLFDKELIENI